MKSKKIKFTFILSAFIISMALMGAGDAHALTVKNSGNRLSDLFVLDNLFSDSQNRILKRSGTDLGDLFILDQLFPVQTTAVSATVPSLSQRLSGRILLQVEQNGEAWYVNPITRKRVSLGTPTEAFATISSLSLGISNQDYNNIIANGAPSNLLGRFIIKAEDKGQIYYINPVNKQVLSVANPAEAADVIMQTGLGITNSDLNKITIAT